jgi:hypothetical protein
MQISGGRGQVDDATEQLRLSPDCKVVGQFVGTVTRRAIKKLVEHYQSDIDVYPRLLNPSSISVLL